MKESNKKKKILIIDANPSRFSYTACLAEEYEINAKKSGFEVETLILRDMTFDCILHFGYTRHQTLEDDLKRAQKLIKWCDHIVLVSPVWWYGMPALLKGFVERTFLPDFAFRVESHPERKLIRMLNDKTATVIYTYGGPKNNMRTNYSDPFGLQLKDGLFYFCGIDKVDLYPLYDTVGFKNIKRRADFIETVIQLGKEGK
ncbi:MAG: NAD(P)H-dependent oxidoreductase [Rickettsiales bacterium]|nr:NAD(P)H-dependent oxidoreductase [Rickettsiales bacterium]